MTTIATDGRSMAGDGIGHCHGTIISTADQKVSRLEDGRIVGWTGSHSDGAMFIEWMGSGGNRRDQPTLEENFGALVLHPDGKVDWYCEKPKPMTPDLPTAIGSGMDIAIGAMLAGKSPEEALHIAARRDVHTGGVITVEHLK